MDAKLLEQVDNMKRMVFGALDDTKKSLITNIETSIKEAEDDMTTKMNKRTKE